MNMEASQNERVKVLVVDDQPGMRLSLKGILSRKGYDVTTAEDGPMAVEAARKTKYNMILMDIKMPGMSGVDAFLKIREFQPGVTVIMMTAFAVEDEIKRAILEGAYAVVHKPFEMEKILSVITEGLENRTLVLLVDDNLDDREILHRVLENKGYKVMEVGTGEECLRHVKERHYQVILLDYKLPGIDGLETLAQVKQIRPDVGVVMISAFSESEQLNQGIAEGSLTYLRKPLDTEKLIAVVDECMKQRGKNG